MCWNACKRFQQKRSLSCHARRNYIQNKRGRFKLNEAKQLHTAHTIYITVHTYQPDHLQQVNLFSRWARTTSHVNCWNVANRWHEVFFFPYFLNMGVTLRMTESHIHAWGARLKWKILRCGWLVCMMESLNLFSE